MKTANVRTSRFIVLYVIFLSITHYTSTVRADDLAEPELARAIAEQAWASFDGIYDLECVFQSTMHPAGATIEEAGKRWDNGYYAYKRGGYELVRYEETVKESPAIGWTYVLTPKRMRGWRDDPERGSRTGAVQQPTLLNFRLQWAPGQYLPLGLWHDKLRYYLNGGEYNGGEYVVRLPNGTDGNPELITPVRAKDKEPAAPDAARRDIVYVLTLARDKGMSPQKIEWFRGDKKEVETNLDLAEVAPGVWLAEHGTCKQLIGGQGVYAKGVESEFWIEPGSVRVNAGIEESFFDADFPPGTRVVDRINHTQYTRDAGESISNVSF
jgi:hypothetical protein